MPAADSTSPIRIATRSSTLALWQAEHVADSLRAADANCTVELVRITTQGDRDRVQSLASLGGIGVFTREVQQALLDGAADLAVHSLKDLPTEYTAGLTLAAVLPRAPRCDALLLPNGHSCRSLDDLPRGAKVGTGSLRRQAQLRSRRPDLILCEIRGNLDTRLKKLDAGEFDAIILAEAGLRRLGWDQRISLLLDPPYMYPAVGQGAIGVECRGDNSRLLRRLEKIDDARTRCEVLAERACLAALKAGCHAPVGVWTRIEPDGGAPLGPDIDSRLYFEAVVWSPDGRERIGVTLEESASDPVSIGVHAAEVLRQAGADRHVGGRNGTGTESP
jgi:hydroxymethylbilane synthase